MPSRQENILVISLSGIGNFLMQSPAIELLKRHKPDARLAVWVAPRNTAVLARANPAVDEVIRAPIKRPLSGHFRQILAFRRQHFSTGIIMSPGQLWKSAAYLAAAGIPQRIGHRYPHLGNSNSAFLLTNAILEDPNLHDVEQNLRLLPALGLHLAPGTTDYTLAIPEKNAREGDREVAKLKINPTKALIGLHPGSAANFLWKRWPADSFAEVGQRLAKRMKAHVIIFGGPDEAKLKKQIQRKIGKQRSSIISARLLTTAAIIKRCRLFISNDSGLMHVAAAIGVPTFGLFGPTDEQKTGPRGANAHIIRAPGTQPVYDTEKNFDFGTEPHDSLLKLTPQTVLDKLDTIV